jgi:hypothetical protein
LVDVRSKEMQLSGTFSVVESALDLLERKSYLPTPHK